MCVSMIFWGSFHRRFVSLPIKVWWEFCLIVIKSSVIRSQQRFAHGTIAHLSCHVQNFASITLLYSKREQNNIFKGIWIATERISFVRNPICCQFTTAFVMMIFGWIMSVNIHYILEWILFYEFYHCSLFYSQWRKIAFKFQISAVVQSENDFMCIDNTHCVSEIIVVRTTMNKMVIHRIFMACRVLKHDNTTRIGHIIWQP